MVHCAIEGAFNLIDNKIRFKIGFDSFLSQGKKKISQAIK